MHRDFFGGVSGMGDNRFCLGKSENSIYIRAPRYFGNLNYYESLHYRVRDCQYEVILAAAGQRK